ncbi:MAG: DUF4388 domain-containing protein [Myxococcales bacterium]|nr:DUF4388 domain-containing protein [Myxococcales bacterium]
MVAARTRRDDPPRRPASDTQPGIDRADALLQALAADTAVVAREMADALDRAVWPSAQRLMHRLGSRLDALRGRLALQTPVAPPMLSGDLAQIGLMPLLEFLRLDRHSGRLVVTSRLGQAILELVQGRLTGARTTGTADLESRLLDQGLVAVEAMEAARAQGGPLVRALLDRGLVDANGLRPVVSEQAADALTEMLAWDDARFVFHRSADDQEVPLAVDTGWLTLEVARRLDEADRKGPRRYQ